MSINKILYVDNFKDIIGGGQISLLGLLEKLDKERFSPMVVLPGSGELSERLREMKIDFEILDMPALRSCNLIGFFRGISRFKRLIRQEGIAIVHANGSRAAIYSGIAAKREGVPFIWHVRIADSDGLLDRFLVGLATKIIAISDAVNRRFSWMKEREKKVVTIYNGIDLAKFNPSISGGNIRKELGLNFETPLVATVGRLDWYKGHQYFLRAAKRVAERIPQCRFLIVGDGDKRKELENLAAELRLDKNVIFAGSRIDIPQILAGIDLFVLSSVSEGLGRSIIEAMAMQKPVVATNAGGIPEIVRDRETGILVPPKDELVLSEAIIGLLQDRGKASKMGILGREVAEEKFDIKKNAEKIQALYSGLLGNS